MELVETFITDIAPQEKPVENQEAPSPVTNKMSHVINKTANGNKGVVAMTPAGSHKQILLGRSVEGCSYS